MKKKLGKISHARWGKGGYQDAMVGLSLTFDMKGGTSVGTFLGAWATQRREDCKWSENDRLIEIGKAGMKVAEMLEKIDGTDVNDLIGTPVEVILDGNMLTDWRLLEEVL